MWAAAIHRKTSMPPSIFIPPSTRSSSRSSPAKIGAGAISTRLSLSSPDWPPLPYSEWESTRDTLHMWTQIVGKTRKELTPLKNHWWNVTLYVTPRGLTTSTIPYDGEAFEVQFDFLRHRLLIETSRGEERGIELRPRSVADFYSEYMATLGSLGIAVKIHTTPDEFDDKTPFERDRKHESYDRKYAENWDTQLGEFFVNYDDVRAAASPDQAILDFCQSTYEAGAKLAQWDRHALERGA